MNFQTVCKPSAIRLVGAFIYAAWSVGFACIAYLMAENYAYAGSGEITTSWSAPKLLKPSDGTVLDGDEKDIPQSFVWTAVPGVDDYLVLLKRDGIVVVSQATKKRSVRIKLKQRGFYSWQIIARSKRKNRLPLQSELQTFEVVDSTGENAERIELVFPVGRVLASDEPLPFVWAQRPDLTYSLQVYKKRPDRSIATVRSGQDFANYQGESAPLFLPPGDYQWHVEGRREDEGGLVPSTVRQFKVERFNERAPGTGIFAVTAAMNSFTYITNNSLYESTLSPKVFGPTLESSVYLPRNFALDGEFAYYRGAALAAPFVSGSLGFRHGVPLWGRRAHIGLGAKVGYDSMPEMIPNVDEFDQASYSTGVTTRWTIMPFGWASLQTDKDVRLFFEGGLKLRVMSTSTDYTDGIAESEPAHLQFRIGVEGAWFWPFGLRLDGSWFSDGFRYSLPGDVVEGIAQGFQIRFGVFYAF